MVSPVVLAGANGTPNYAGAGYTSSSYVPDGTNPARGPVFTPATAPVQNMPSPSSTVLSNANIIENTIPALNSKASTLVPNPATTLAKPDPAMAPPTTDYSSLYKGAYDSLPDITDDPQYKRDMDLINSVQQENDGLTSAYVNSIQKNYLDSTNQQIAANQGSDNKIANALLLGGSSRYAPISSGGILDLKTRGDIQQLGSLQDQENQKIAEVRNAQASQDYKTMSDKMSELDKLTTNKQTLAKSIADNMLKTNQTSQTAAIQNQKDNAIATLVHSGTTDPGEILSALTQQGYANANLKDITTTLANIQKTTGTGSLQKLSGGVGAFYTLKANNELPGDIASLPQDQQLFSYLKAYHSANVTPKSSSTRATSGGTGGKTITSGTFTYSPQDFATDSAVLEKSRGSDNYVDPAVYQKFYNEWINGGGKIADFIKVYPPKEYVNPTNTTLPTYLRPPITKAKATSTASNPFG